ncbi:MAG: hypothetical protein AAB646_02205 [Patescibacteria group bacterium]|mgnify:CR=1 FL=1
MIRIEDLPLFRNPSFPRFILAYQNLLGSIKNTFRVIGVFPDGTVSRNAVLAELQRDFIVEEVAQGITDELNRHQSLGLIDWSTTPPTIKPV